MSDSVVDPNTGIRVVTLQFTGHGSKEFRRITKAEYNRDRINAGRAGQLNSTHQATINQYAGHNALVLDGQLKETPFIDYADSILAQGIVGNARITEPSARQHRRARSLLRPVEVPKERPPTGQPRELVFLASRATR